MTEGTSFFLNFYIQCRVHELTEFSESLTVQRNIQPEDIGIQLVSRAMDAPTRE